MGDLLREKPLLIFGGGGAEVLDAVLETVGNVYGAVGANRERHTAGEFTFTVS